MTQKKAQLMVPPTSGRVGAVKAGTGISIGMDGTICATGGGGGGVFSADANNNIWSCNTAITSTSGGAADNFLVGLCAGANLSAFPNLNNTFIGKCAGFCAGTVEGLEAVGNNFFGCGAGKYALTGSYNNFIGYEAGSNSDDSFQNNFFGYKAGSDSNYSYYTNFIGAEAGRYSNDGYYNNFIGFKAGGNGSYGYYNNFIGACAGQNEQQVNNNYLGLKAGKGVEAVNRLESWVVDSATVIPSQVGLFDYYYYSVSFSTTSGTDIEGWVIRYNGTLRSDVSDSFLFSAFGSIIDGETAVIPGYQIGGSSPADDATITLYAGTFANENYSSLAIGSYAASENWGQTYSNLAIGTYAGQYTGYEEFNHIFLGTGAGQRAYGGFYNIYIGSYAGCSAGGNASFSNTFIGTLAGKYAANSFYQTHVGAYSGYSVVHPTGWTGGGNQLFGSFSGTCITTGDGNSMFGLYSGEDVTTGSYNSFFGMSSASGITTGSYNVAFGYYAGARCYYDRGCGVNPAGWRSSCGNNNTHIGTWSGVYQPGNSSSNVALGFMANSGTNLGLGSLTYSPSTTIPSQADCTYIVPTNCFSTLIFPNGDPGYPGSVKVSRNSSGAVCEVCVIDPGWRQCRLAFTCIPGTFIGGTSADNLAITSRTLISSDSNTCNFDNVFIGTGAGKLTFYGTRNFFGGFRAGAWSGYYATDNVAIGSYAGFCMGSYSNIAIGCCAGALSSGGYNLMLGKAAGQCNKCWFTTLIGGYTGYYNQADGSTFVGWEAGQYNTTGVANTFVGNGAGQQNTTGLWNSIFGAGAGGNITTGEGNTLIGAGVAQIISTGSRNVAVGCWAMQSAGDVSNNIAIGHCAFRHPSNLPGCDWNIAIGSETLRYGAIGSVAIGGCSLSRVIGNCSTAVGYFALKGTGDGTTFLTSSGNSVFGWCSMVGVTTGSSNSAFGLFSGLSNSSGSFNAFFGQNSGCNNTTGSNNVAIGSSAGTDAVLNLTTQSNQIVVGNNSHTNAFVKVGWTVTSDERDKTCVTSVRHGLDFLEQITPVQYNWKNRETDEVTDETPRYGFLAQDILAAEGDPAILVDTQDPDNLKLRESMMIPVLVQAIKELHDEVKALKQQIQL